MTPTKQTVYLPKSTFPLSIKGKVDDLFCLQQGYIFTPEELNAYTQSVIKQALKTAALKAVTKDEWEGNTGSEYCNTVVDRQSIINTFKKTFKKFKV